MTLKLQTPGLLAFSGSPIFLESEAVAASMVSSIRCATSEAQRRRFGSRETRGWYVPNAGSRACGPLGLATTPADLAASRRVTAAAPQEHLIRPLAAKPATRLGKGLAGMQ